jgi:predicted Zn-dependent protease
MSDIQQDGYYTWPKEKFPVKVYMQPGDGTPGYKSYYPDMMRDCFNEWCQAAGGRLSWQEVNDPKNADIKINWSDQVVEEVAGTEAGKTRTYARYNPNTNFGIIQKADMRLLTRLPEREFSDNEVKKAYLHEVGHAFGIAGHSNNRHDIMYHAVVNTQHPAIGARDIATLDHIYDLAPQMAAQASAAAHQAESAQSSSVQAEQQQYGNRRYRSRYGG